MNTKLSDFKQKKYSLELEFDGFEVLDEGPWHKAQYIDAYGDTLDECIDNATVFYIDQDGGEYRSTSAERDDEIEAIRLGFEESFGLFLHEYVVEIFKGADLIKSLTVWASDHCAAYDSVKGAIDSVGVQGFRVVSRPKL